MSEPVEFDRLVPVDAMVGEDQSETEMLRSMLRDAETFLTSHKWCPPIVERFLGFGVGGVVAVFLFRVSEKVHGTDDLLWVVEGDLPSAYLVTDGAPNPAAALSGYADIMEDWANAVLTGSALDEVFPVHAAPTAEHANMLLSRIKFIRERLIPLSQGDLRPPA